MMKKDSKREPIKFLMNSDEKLELVILLKKKRTTLQKFFEDTALRYLKRERKKDNQNDDE